jgi:hypothetical protein
VKLFPYVTRWFAAVAAAAAILALPVGAAADSSSTNGNTQHFGPFDSVSVDNGSCSLPWALDTDQREFKVSDNGDGTFTVREEYKNGSFVTTAGGSPGACDTDSNHGTLVLAGVHGTFTGYLEGTVSGGTYNPGGCDVTGAVCNTTTGFILAVFGPGGTFTCLQGYQGCTFKFEYAAGDQGLIYHHWEDKSSSKDPSVPEVFKGDIANF